MNNDFLEIAKIAARKAGEIHLKYFSQDVDYSLKGDATPVTLADKESEKIIIETIKEKFPDHGFLGEESGKSSSDSEYLWIIDPLDSTKNFIRGLPLFSTEIALMKDDELLVGVSYAAAINDMAFAAKGMGAFVNDKKVEVSKIDDLAESYLSYSNLKYYDQDGSLGKLIELSHKVRSCRAIGDAWPYRRLAEGKIDIVVEASIKIWDIAAITLIIEEAGGKVTDMQGNKINLDSTTILATNGKLHQEILDSFNKDD